MVALFAFEFVEDNTITRLYFMWLRRLSLKALRRGQFTPELIQVRAEPVPTHFLDLPILMLIVSLGALQQDTWSHFIIGTMMALAVAIVLTLALPRLYPGDPALAASGSKAA